MKILLALNSFKESLSAHQVVESVARGLRKQLPKARIIKLPVADGGEGTLEILVTALQGFIVTRRVTGPLGHKVRAKIGFTPHPTSPTRGEERCKRRTAIIEMAQASGLQLVSPCQRNPLLSHTYGTGELIKYALDKRAKKIIIGIGGSATVDAGVGMAKALGYRFLDKSGKEINSGGGNIGKLYRIDSSARDKRLSRVEIMVACDVGNPFLGPKGAARVFAPQKGATPKMVKILENNLGLLAKIIKKDLGKDVRRLKGGGSSGGLGAGLYAFCNAKLYPGAELILDIIGFKKHLKNSDLVIVGEGKLDETSLYGKAPVVIARMAKKVGVPVTAICGISNIEHQKLSRVGIRKCIAISKQAKSIGDSIRHAAQLLENLPRNSCLR